VLEWLVLGWLVLEWLVDGGRDSLGSLDCVGWVQGGSPRYTDGISPEFFSGTKSLRILGF